LKIEICLVFLDFDFFSLISLANLISEASFKSSGRTLSVFSSIFFKPTTSKLSFLEFNFKKKKKKNKKKKIKIKIRIMKRKRKIII